MSIAATLRSVPTGIPRSLRIFLTEARYEFIRLLRTRGFSLSVIGFPVVFYIFFGLIMNRGVTIHGVSVAKYTLATYSVFGMVGAALFGIGVGLAGELNAGWLELKRASPMPPLAYLLAKCSSAMAFGVIIVCLLCALGITAGHVSVTGAEVGHLLALTVIGVIPFACLGMVVALVVPFNSAPGFTNMIYLPMSFCGGLWIPIMMLPKVMQKFAFVLPTYHLSQLTLGVFGYASAGTPWSHWFGLLGFSLVMLGVASIAFHRLEKNS
ncbi:MULTISPECIES: ABC transporter permease [Acidobacteriaceae]|uniref:ABC transporter permease n=1 Tax=Acidobacteriaceae TaxID=204434 RepID=UPI00131D8EDE|nr:MULTISPECIES: ABC transporter permease [Acidobacteriaceae]MDW5265040.1 ABC transporter permease [Edaphobacter sp.]